MGNAPTRVFFNGDIITLDPQVPRAEAMVVSGEHIVAIGSKDDIASLVGTKAEYIDLDGQVVLPGFNDSHMHLLAWGQAMGSINLAAAQSVDEIIRLGRKFAENHRDAPWLIGRGWSDENFSEPTLPVKEHLDCIAADRPVLLSRVCGHVCAVNSKALALAGIDRNTPDPPGGTIDRSPDTGEPTGILRENAMGLVWRHVPDLTVTDLKATIREAAIQAAAFGLTSVQTNDLDGAATMDIRLEAFRQLAQSGDLPIRINLQAAMPTLADLHSYIKIRSEFREVSHLKLGPLKLFADGSLGAKTAALSAPYADAPDTCGIPIYTQTELDELVCEAARVNLQVATHAIGDRAMDMVLDSYEQAKRKFPSWTARPRIVHCQITSWRNLERMAALGVVADIQPIFVPTDLHFVDRRVGQDRAASSYAWKTMRKIGVRTAGGSDCPVESCNPLWGIHAAVTRQDRTGYPEGGWRPAEKLSPEEAIELFTIGSAYACHEEAIKGTLSPGKLADFVVLPANPAQVEPEKLLHMKVTATYVGGNRIWPTE